MGVVRREREVRGWVLSGGVRREREVRGWVLIGVVSREREVRGWILIGGAMREIEARGWVLTGVVRRETRESMAPARLAAPGADQRAKERCDIRAFRMATPTCTHDPTPAPPTTQDENELHQGTVWMWGKRLSHL